MMETEVFGWNGSGEINYFANLAIANTQKIMRRALTLFFVLTAAAVQAQDLTGVWQGHFRSGNLSTRSSLIDDRYKFEVQIAQHNKTFDAVTYSNLSSYFYGKAAADGTLNPKNGKVILQEVKLLEVRNQTGGVCIMTCFLQYSKSGEDEFLEGTFSSMDARDSSNCGRGTVFLRKVSSSDFYKEPFLAKREKEIAEEAKKTAANKPPVKNKPTGKPPVTNKPANTHAAPPTATKQPAATDKQQASVAKHPTPPVAKPPAPPPALASVHTPNAVVPASPRDTGGGVAKNFGLITPEVLRSRSNVLAKSIIVHTNEVTLNIYDDGAIDNDTISVYLDKKMVISHAMLTDQPIVLTLHLDETENFHEIVMVAENEGEIPPNTSLMIVKAGDQRYEVRIVSSEQKNAVVTFKYEKNK